MIAHENRIIRRQTILFIVVFAAALIVSSLVAHGDPALGVSEGYGDRLNEDGVVLSPEQVKIDRLTDQNQALRLQLRKERDAHANTVKRLRSALNAKSSINSAIRLAAVTTGVPESQIRSVAHCESRLHANAVGRTPVGSERAVGLMQFLPSTFRRTAFGRAGLDPMDPYVSALAAASIASKEGWRQWACKPGKS